MLYKVMISFILSESYRNIINVKLKSIECQKLDGLTDTQKNFREGVRKIVLCTFNFPNPCRVLSVFYIMKLTNGNNS